MNQDLKEKALSYHKDLPDRIIEYLKNRGISAQISTKYLIGWNGRTITIPIFNQAGEISFFKYRKDPADTSEKSKYWCDEGSSPELYGWEHIKELKPFLVICEGELDKLCLESNNIPAITSTGGARTFRDHWITAVKDSQSVVLICFDNDLTGLEASASLAARLRSAKVIKIPKEEGIKDITDYFKTHGKDDFLLLGDNAKTYEQIEADVSLKENPLPLSLPEFLKQDIPPIEYFVSGILPKKGKAMISASTNLCKSILLQNLALAMTCDKKKFFDKFDILPARVLYLDLEMGESALKERFVKMCAKENLVAENLYIKHLPSINLITQEAQQLIERWIVELKIDVLIIDPLGNAWVGNENSQEDVRAFVAYLNGLIYKYKISLLLSHHWRKATQFFKTGGHMAAGSYVWEAYLDHHVTLEGSSENLTIVCAKARNAAHFKSFMVKLNPDSLWLEHLADFEVKYFDSTLVELFKTFGLDKVSVPDLIKQATDKRKYICSESTLRKLISQTKSFEVKREGKTHYLAKKKTEQSIFDNV